MKAMRSDKTERRKSPQQKKQDEYDKDMRPLLENPHALRKNWPKKKARVNRKKRKHNQTAIRAALSKDIVGGPSPELLKTVESLQQFKKHYIISLRQNVKDKLTRRKKS